MCVCEVAFVSWEFRVCLYEAEALLEGVIWDVCRCGVLRGESRKTIWAGGLLFEGSDVKRKEKDATRLKLKISVCDRRQARKRRNLLNGCRCYGKVMWLCSALAH